MVERVEKLLKADPDVEHWSFYVGQGAVRFYLPLDQQLANDFFAQAVVVTKGHKVRDKRASRGSKRPSPTDFDALMARVTPLELGPAGRLAAQVPRQRARPGKTRECAQTFAAGARREPEHPQHQLRLERDRQGHQGRGRPGPGAGARHQLAAAVQQHQRGAVGHHGSRSCATSTYLIDVVARAVPEERGELDTLRNLMLHASGGKHVPLAQLATFSYGLEAPLIWRRQRLPTVTVQAEVPPGIEATTVRSSSSRAIAAVQGQAAARLQGRARRRRSRTAPRRRPASSWCFPLMLFLMVSMLMVQLMSIQRLFLVLLTAPLALIGVAAALLISRRADGLRRHPRRDLADRHGDPQLGDPDRADRRAHRGRRASRAAVISATEHRLRPILLTAAAAILGMIPIAPTVFWGPMAYAVMGGLVVATLLTLVFLPALYVAWFRIEPVEARQPSNLVGAPALAAS